MLTNDYDIIICNEHNKDDCAHCPLLINLSTATCKWNSHYEHGAWVRDETQTTQNSLPEG